MLRTTEIEKPWGRTILPPMFGDTGGRKIGEVWFDGPADSPLLLKYIFTSERLSIQVHPDDAQARKRGLPHGKTECWYILDAEPDATIGLGVRRQLDLSELRAAVLDGSIEHLLDWRPVRAGDFLYVPAGTIHAIGAGISLLEVQQNSDVTYRLYDYGRPRELHIEDGVAVAKAEPYPELLARHVDEGFRGTLVDGPYFRLVLSDADALQDSQRWIVPIAGKVRSGDDRAGPGECLLLEAGERLEQPAERMLIAASC